MDEQELDMALEPALDSIDRATLALHLSRMLSLPMERIEQAQQACTTYKSALRQLHTLSPDVRATTAWQHWEEEARHGFDFARATLDQLGQ